MGSRLMLVGDEGRQAVVLVYGDADLSDRIAKALRPLRAVEPATGQLHVDAAERVVRVGDRVVPLTRREVELFVHLRRRPGTVLSREDLLQAVWGSRSDWQSPATVTEHVRRLRTKLAEHGYDAGIATVRGLGYRYDGARPQ